MRKITLGLAVLVSLLCVEALGDYNPQAKARELDEKCDNGDSEACKDLGDRYSSSLLYDIPEDYPKAIFYYERVCKKGNEKDEYFAPSCGDLGALYHNGGYGVPQDYKKASKFYSLACDGGNVIACQNLGSVYYDSEGVSQDIVKGAEYVKRACDAGDWVACKNFAVYHHNHGDRSKVAQYLKKACELGRNDSSVQNIPEYKEAWRQACNMSDILN